MSSSKRTSVFGVYPTRANAERGVADLMNVGFSSDDISVLLSDNDSSRAFATEKHTKAPEGATTGVIAGGAIGGTLGLLTGIGTLAIPGLGPFIAAGPLMTTLAGLGAGGAVGALIGALSGMGVPEYEAKRYEGRLKAGGILVSVHCDSSQDITNARDTLKRSGAEDISSATESDSDDTPHADFPGYATL